MYLVSRTETFAKLFFIVSFTGLFMYVALAFYTFHTAYSTISQISVYQTRFGKLLDATERVKSDLKYILMWTLNDTGATLQLEGQTPFIYHECPDVNCYITTNRTLLKGYYTNFDAIIFNLSILEKWQSPLLPKHRSARQKYVFYANIPSTEHPICRIVVNNYFNWTWSYKLGSDIFSPFIEVKDMNGDVVAPRKDVVWPKNTHMKTWDTIDEVRTKTKAVVWVMNDCSLSNKLLITSKLRTALDEHYLSLDVYGCGNLECPAGGCLAAIERDYYFYLAYEESASEDYVTEEVLMGYLHDTVPIIVGGADYSKFLPDNSYINYQGYSIDKLAALIAYTIKTPSKYMEFFTWKKQFTIQKVDENRGYCQLCTLLNDEEKVKAVSSYKDFRKWWYSGSLKEKCLPKGAETYSELLSYANVSER